jgi:transcriptional regulator with XRE-family HTH domain
MVYWYNNTGDVGYGEEVPTMMVAPARRTAMKEKEDLARRLRMLRAGENWGLREAAGKIGISPTTLIDAEAGRRVPHGDTLAKISKTYGVPLSALFTDEPAVRIEPRGAHFQITIESEDLIDHTVDTAVAVWEAEAGARMVGEAEFRRNLRAEMRRMFDEVEAQRDPARRDRYRRRAAGS